MMGCIMFVDINAGYANRKRFTTALHLRFATVSCQGKPLDPVKGASMSKPRVVLAIRLDPEINSKISEMATSQHTTKSAMGERLLKRALRMKSNLHVIQKADPDLIRELNAIGKNINQITRVLNKTNKISEVEKDLQVVLEKIRDLI